MKATLRLSSTPTSSVNSPTGLCREEVTVDDTAIDLTPSPVKLTILLKKDLGALESSLLGKISLLLSLISTQEENLKESLNQVIHTADKTLETRIVENQATRKLKEYSI